MALFRNLKQNLLNLQTIFKKRKRSSSASSQRESGRDNSENNPVRSPPEQQQEPIQDIHQVQTSSTVNEASKDSQETPLVEKTETPDENSDQEHSQSGQSALRRKFQNTVPSLSPDSDSEVEDKGVSRCQCSRNSHFSRTSRTTGKTPTSLAEEFYGGNNIVNSGRYSPHNDFNNVPSTSRKEPCGSGGSGGGGGMTDTGQSSCSLEDQLMEEMVSTLKTRGSLSRRRSRSRSRRSRARQSYDNGIVVSNVRVIQTIPRRETDSDDSNTSLNDLCLPFLSSTQQNTLSHSNVQSDSSYHSAAGSQGCITPQTSSANTAKTEEEVEIMPEEDTEEWVGVNSTEHNRSGNDDRTVRQIQELSSYGPEEFVLDLLLAMCRGTWSDIL